MRQVLVKEKAGFYYLTYKMKKNNIHEWFITKKALESYIRTNKLVLV